MPTRPIAPAGEARAAVCPVHSVDRRRESQRILDVAEKGANVSAEVWASLLGTINYEVVSRINPELPRLSSL